MNHQNSYARPSEHAESALVMAILDGKFPPGSTLPGERVLAGQLGVTRPTLREAIQRLARDGWLTVAHGKPTLVNDFWRKGGLNVLGRLIEHQAHLPADFIPNLLEVRLQLAPTYTRAAISRVPAVILDLLASAPDIEDPPVTFARFDWQLHQQLTIHSGNPIYTLILNGFSGFYEDIAQIYFAENGARELSVAFYEDLRQAVTNADPAAAEALTRRVMMASLDVWRGEEMTTEKIEE